MVDEEPEDISPTAGPAMSRVQLLAANRTAMAAGRSLNSWTSTGVSLISFGFTIYMFLIRLDSVNMKNAVAVGLYLVGLGTVTMLYGIYEYRATLRELHKDYGVQFNRAPIIFGLFVAGLGIILFFRIVVQIYRGIP